MAKSENISIKSIIQKKQLDDLNKSVAEQTILLKSIETRMMSTESATGNIETTEEKSLRVSVEAKKEAQEAYKKAASDRDREIKLRASEIKAITEMGLNQKIYKGFLSKIGGAIVDKVTPKWVKAIPETLTKISNLTGGEKRKDVKEFVSAQQDRDPSKTRASLIKDWKELQETYKEIAKNEDKLKKRRGSQSEGTFLQLAPGKVFSERREMLATKVKSLDKSAGFEENEDETYSPTGIPSIVPTESSPTGMPSIVPTESHEDKTERQLQESKTQDILEKIEVNTRPEVVLTNPKEAGESDGSGGLLGGLLGGIGLLTMMKSLKNLIGGIFESIGTALMGAFRLLFNPGAILKGILKGFAITALVVAIGKGIYDGFIEWQKTGDIGKAIVEGLGAMVETLTFGLISKEKYKEYAKWFNGKVDEYIITPITNFISHVCDLFDEWIATPIKNAFASIGKFFSETMDSFMSLIQGIGIPEIDISSVSKYIPGAPDKLGPWYPFADSATKESPKPVPKGANNVTPEATPTTSGTKYIPYNRDNASIVHQKSEENIGRKEDMNAKGAGSTIVSAPSSTINNQTVNKNITRLPPTNQHGPYVKINQVGW